jgi:UDP-MurNAc hydroxylase
MRTVPHSPAHVSGGQVRADMKVTALGHASILVELNGATCLMDPVFFDPFEEGAVVSCPKRIVYPEKLLPIDILVVSHRHPDHFDIPSLARISRDCDAICPADPLIVYALQKLGFSRIHPVHPMGSIASADFELYPSRSEVGSVREFGMVFRDRSGTFWNQVDTSLSADTIATVLGRFGPVDLLFAMHASQNFDFSTA